MKSCLEHEINIHLTNIYLAPAVCQTVLKGEDILVEKKKKKTSKQKTPHLWVLLSFWGRDRESRE